MSRDYEKCLLSYSCEALTLDVSNWILLALIKLSILTSIFLRILILIEASMNINFYSLDTFLKLTCLNVLIIFSFLEIFDGVKE